MTESLEELCRRLEHWETERWAADAVLQHELLTSTVVDPCCGTGIMTEAAKRAGYQDVLAFDIHDWGYAGTQMLDWLSDGPRPDWSEATAFLNPPFKKAAQFVKKCLELNFREIVCYERFSWFESGGRADFWD